MHIFYFSRDKKRFILYSIMVIFWVIAFVLLSYLIQEKVYKTTAFENEFSIVHPLKITIESSHWQSNLFGNLKSAATFPENSPSFKEYYSKKAGVSFKYPSVFNANEQDFTGGEILFHVDLASKDLSNHGFVEVWKLNVPLDKFLSSSLGTSNQSFKSFSQKPITSNNISGVLWDYSIVGKDNTEHKCLEAFLYNDSKMYRISLFMPLKDYTPENYDMFIKMVDSLVILK